MMDSPVCNTNLPLQYFLAEIDKEKKHCGYVDTQCQTINNNKGKR